MDTKLLNVDYILKKYHDGSCPINSINVAKSLGFKVCYKDMGETDWNFKITGNKITLDINDTKLRHQYTVSYAIGYCVFSEELFGNKESLKIDFSIRSQVHNFAMDLLLPKEFINHFIFKKRITKINRLATLLDVSYSVMFYRLKYLNLI